MGSKLECRVCRLRHVIAGKVDVIQYEGSNVHWQSTSSTWRPHRQLQLGNSISFREQCFRHQSIKIRAHPILENEYPNGFAWAVLEDLTLSQLKNWTMAWIQLSRPFFDTVATQDATFKALLQPLTYQSTPIELVTRFVSDEYECPSSCDWPSRFSILHWCGQSFRKVLRTWQKCPYPVHVMREPLYDYQFSSKYGWESTFEKFPKVCHRSGMIWELPSRHRTLDLRKWLGNSNRSRFPNAWSAFARCSTFEAVRSPVNFTPS
jgi:hypothetical protein